jgi:hypothetical protein
LLLLPLLPLLPLMPLVMVLLLSLMLEIAANVDIAFYLQQPNEMRNHTLVTYSLVVDMVEEETL